MRRWKFVSILPHLTSSLWANSRISPLNIRASIHPTAFSGGFMFAIWKKIPIIASAWTNTTKYVTICNNFLFFFTSKRLKSDQRVWIPHDFISSYTAHIPPRPWYTAAETWRHSKNIEQADYREGKFISPSGLNAQECHVAAVYLQQRLAGM